MNKKLQKTKSNSGSATLEITVLLIVFIVVTTYAIGFFGVIHTGIKNSIAARSLAFETFRNRANVYYWRDNNDERFEHYRSKGSRNHGVISEQGVGGSTGASSPYYATARQIAYIRNPDFKRSNGINGEGLPRGLERQEANAVFIKTKYGICLNANCGD